MAKAALWFAVGSILYMFWKNGQAEKTENPTE